MTDLAARPDPTALLVTHAAARNGTGAPVIGPAEADTALRCARYARHAYPGPVGELISTDIHAAVAGDLPAGPVVRRVVSALRTMERSRPLPPLEGDRRLPARHVPGSGGRWAYRTAADDAC
ncbi:hypothetical protein Acsp06_41150 [Actinomycetospora sp. NBRC 106375]|uniref:hypothetical protein n=1 Tax=Actinomycetospora sp. NBRC 106375 TaxID=3032207 RepID=UPI0024A561D4|nr:hypothetical protein [Actinomycetospora sp. NBRC 106375]GLZ47930.1 hypothetical protein Acsp06_41150 [Actinomycetospora sp. NBRC 106375]